MEHVENFQDILEAADRLSLEDKEALIDVLQRRLVDQRREEIAREIEARPGGNSKPASASP